MSIVLFLIVQSCKRSYSDEELTINKIVYTGTDIRLDGCYVSDSDELKKYNAYKFFYSNGVYFGFSDMPNINSRSQITNIDYKSNYKGYWGLFQVQNKTIIVQTWKMSDVNSQFIIQNRAYKIINDTTLSCDLLNDGDITYYHFKPFSPKPDSTNVFIK